MSAKFTLGKELMGKAPVPVGEAQRVSTPKVQEKGVAQSKVAPEAPPLLSLSALSVVWLEGKLVDLKEGHEGGSKAGVVKAIAELYWGTEQSIDWVQKQVVETWERQPKPTRGDRGGHWVDTQHFVPCFYLKKWLIFGDSYLRARFRYGDAPKGPERMLQKPRLLCSVKHLYSQKFERWIASTVETRCAKILDDLVGGREMGPGSLEWLVALIATTYIRSPVVYERFKGSRCCWLRDGIDFIAQDLVPLLVFLLRQKWVLAKVERALPTSDCPVVALSSGLESIAQVDLVAIAKGGGVIEGAQGVFVLMPLTPYYVLMCQAGPPCKGLSKHSMVDAIVAASDGVILEREEVAPRTLKRLKRRLSGGKAGGAYQIPSQEEPKATPKTTPKTTPKAVPKVAPKAAPKVAPKAAPKAVPKAAPKATPERASNAEAQPARKGAKS